jgi:hypothetical protein
LETLVFSDKTGWKYQRNSTQGTINASDLENPAQTVLKFKSGGAWEYYVLYKGTLA